MPIINTDKMLKVKSQKQKEQVKSKKFFCFLLVFFHFCFFLFPLLSGCSQKNDLKQAQDYIKQSDNYYQAAVNIYKGLVKKGIDSDRLHLELGKLYYGHGEFRQAVEEFKESKELNAKKFLAISYYHLGNFTDALEIFNKYKIKEEEYLFYHGLTCERLNLFDQALDIYGRISSPGFIVKAKARINIIERQENPASIKDIDQGVYKILAGAPKAEQYPQAGALVLFCDEKIEITPEGTMVSDLHYIIKILNERGKADFSETHIDYDSTYEKVELEYARTIKPDGAVVEVGSRHIRDVSKYLNFPLYSNVRVCIISFPEITEDSVIEYKIKIYDNQLINKKDFVLAYTVQAQEPIIEANFNVSLPKDRPLHLKMLNDKYNDFGANLNPKTKEDGGFLIYSWQFKDIPQIIPESQMPPVVQINPTILISTFNNWQEIYDWWWKLAKDKIKPDEAIKAKVKELIQNRDSIEEKSREIYNFCAQKIRYVAVEYGEAGYEPHFASDIFKNKYGDCKDQAILLVTMLKEAGIESWPVLIATREYYNLNKDFPSMLFNHCIAAVSLKDRTVFLDPTAQTCSFMDLPPDDQGRKVLIVKESGFEIQETDFFPVEHNLNKQLISLKIDKDETVLVKKSIFTYGLYDQVQRYWLLYTQPELIREIINQKIQDISIGAKLNKYNIENLVDLNSPIVLSYEFWGPEFFTVAGRLRIMPQLTGIDTSLVAKDKRKYALDFGVLDTKETVYEFEIPNNFTIKYIPDNVTEDSQWLKLIVEYGHKDNKIYFKQKTQLKKSIVTEEEYPQFKNLFEGIAKKTKQRIVLEIKK
jgi:tetratricopeptide (TPR) repeat protein